MRGCVPGTRASIAGGSQFRGIRILEELGQGKVETRYQVAAVELGRLGQDLHRCQGSIDVNLPGDGIDDPNLLNTGSEVVDQFEVDLVRAVRLAHDLDDQVGDEVPSLGLGSAPANRPLLCRDESQVGASLQLPRAIEPEESLDDHLAQLLGVDNLSQHEGKEGRHIALVRTHGRQLHDLTIDDLVKAVVRYGRRFDSPFLGEVTQVSRSAV